jgi:hypothetical protein
MEAGAKFFDPENIGDIYLFIYGSTALCWALAAFSVS